MPNGEFAKRSDMCAVKKFVFTMAGSKFDKMALEKGQKYYFIFVHEDGEGLREVLSAFGGLTLKIPKYRYQYYCEVT